MKKDSADEKKPRRSPRLSREQKSDTTPSQGTAEDGRTGRTRRKAGPVVEDLRVRVLKRKVRDDGEGAAKTTKKRRRLDPDQGGSASSSADTESSSNTKKRRRRRRKRRGKRKAADHTGEGPSSKRTRTPDLKEDHQEKDQKENQGKDEDHQEENQDHQEDNQEKDQDHQEDNQDHQEKDQDHQEENQEKDQDHQEENQEKHQENRQQDQEDLTAGSPGVSKEFEAKYEQQEQLGEGGCGCVFAGFRKADHLPVAIKHIPKEKTLGKYPDNEGRQASVEVAIMLKLGAGTSGSAGASAPVSLLDWYDLGPKLILVMERPVPCVDLFDYVRDNGGSLQEKEAKIILKQLVSAARELEDQQIFHRDIKRENILIETGADVPRVRLIDFGLGCFTKKNSLFRNFCGTPAHVPPELYVQHSYRAGPTTVWQMGVVLFDSLHRKVKFETTMFAAKRIRINRKLSKDCRDFLQTCLTLDPKQRPTLEQLQHHPWLR